MVPLTTLLTTCDTNISPSGVNCQASDVSTHFNDLDLRNAMVSLITPSASHDSDANLNGIT